MGEQEGIFEEDLTYVEYHGCSTVDSVLSSEETLIDPDFIQYLSILELNVLSEPQTCLTKPLCK